MDEEYLALIRGTIESVEKQLFEIESRYLDETLPFGNVVRGWEGFLDKKVARSNERGGPKRDKRFKPSDRIFSYSSVTSPIDPSEIQRERDKDDSPSPTFKRSSSKGKPGQTSAFAAKTSNTDTSETSAAGGSNSNVAKDGAGIGRGARKKRKRKQADEDVEFMPR